MNTSFFSWRKLMEFGIGAIAISTLILAGCGGGGGGGGGSSGTLSGTFVDKPVAGLSYMTSSSGTWKATDSQGQFQYTSGDTVTFAIGGASGITLGSTKPQPGNNGATNVTPISLVTGATDATNPTVQAIGQLLGTLNSIAVANGNGTNGMFTIPASALTYLSTAGITSVSAVSNTTLDNLVTGISGASAVTAAQAQANITAGQTATGVIGSMWTGTASGGSGGNGGTGWFFFQPNGGIQGFVHNSSGKGNLLSGVWSSVSSGVSLTLVTTDGGGASAVIATNATTGSGTTSDGSTLTLTELSGSSTSVYAGGWYVTYTPNTYGLQQGNNGGSAYIILAPNSNIYGITDGGEYISGTWNSSTGKGSASFTDHNGNVVSVSLTMANSTITATVTSNGQSIGSLAFSPTGSIQLSNTSSGTGSGSSGNNGYTIPLLLNVQVLWPQNVGNVPSSFVLSLNIYDNTSTMIAGGIRPESNPMGVGAAANTTTDNFAVSYLQGTAATYSLSTGQSSCWIQSGGSGTVNDAYSGHANDYPTVVVNCGPR